MATRLQSLLSPRQEYRLLAVMLVLLHLALWWDFGGALSRSLALAHLGLFLIWQPIWSREQRLSWRGSGVFLLATAAFIVWLNWWLMTFWLLLLTGLVGGRITLSRHERYAYLLALLFLVSELLIAAIPNLFPPETLTDEVELVFGRVLVVLPLALLFVRRKSEPATVAARPVDFVYGLTIAMLAAILGLGSVLGMYYTGVPYAVALFQAAIGIGLFLIAISWLWAPHAGFSGLGQLWQQYLLNIGTPIETWLAGLEDLAQRRQGPLHFLRGAMRQLLKLPWVAGVRWTCREREGREGHSTPHAFTVEVGHLGVTLYAHRPMGAALIMHGKLLIKIIAHFHRAKEREQELARQAHLQAVHETGARITHDIKNLLQSLHTMSQAVQQGDPARRAELGGLLRRQLPHLTQRLQLALDKLQAPHQVTATEGSLSDWWESLKARHADDGIRFESDIRANPLIPVELFDRVAENLLENARHKRQAEPGIEIGVELVADGDGTRLLVDDTGSPVDPEVAEDLFKGPVRSRNGLGIGLYQIARQAEQLGYTLALRRSEQGAVRFELQGPVDHDAREALRESGRQ